MGVSLTMKVRVGHRVYADPVDISFGFKSETARVLREHFRSSPHRLDREDVGLIETLAEGASPYTFAEKNVWRIIAAAIAEHGGVEIEAEY